MFLMGSEKSVFYLNDGWQRRKGSRQRAATTFLGASTGGSEFFDRTRQKIYFYSKKLHIELIYLELFLDRACQINIQVSFLDSIARITRSRMTCVFKFYVGVLLTFCLKRSTIVIWIRK